MKKILIDLMGEIVNNSTIIVGDFSTPLLIMSRTTRKKIIKETESLDNTINQLD